ncbi:hypothetical protein E2C01_012238 [Portunus trituberculatus]|uniref:Uncharacterized protein n=1 Tax=Portunus trituberculatus TaxID=210409 RepID=A0A5B7DE05_PORTR|nr:hypothetical protein [Portunus trituberculatus]
MCKEVKNESTVMRLLEEAHSKRAASYSLCCLLTRTSSGVAWPEAEAEELSPNTPTTIAAATTTTTTCPHRHHRRPPAMAATLQALLNDTSRVSSALLFLGRVGGGARPTCEEPVGMHTMGGERRITPCYLLKRSPDSLFSQPPSLRPSVKRVIV